MVWSEEKTNWLWTQKKSTCGILWVSEECPTSSSRRNSPSSVTPTTGEYTRPNSIAHRTETRAHNIFNCYSVETASIGVCFHTFIISINRLINCNLGPTRAGASRLSTGPATRHKWRRRRGRLHAANRRRKRRNHRRIVHAAPSRWRSRS